MVTTIINEKKSKESAFEKYLLVMPQNDIDHVQKKIGYSFNNRFLLVQAFVRRSFAAENQGYEDNESLEFVGDKVLDFIVVKKLTDIFGFTTESSVPAIALKGFSDIDCDTVIERNFEFGLSEGEMTEAKKQIVQTRFLSSIVEGLGLEKYLIMGKGDIINNVQNEPHVKEDLFEAIIGAIAIDSGWNIAVIEVVVESLLNLEHHLRNGVEDGVDYITYIQNWHQKEYGVEPNYVFYNVDDSGETYQCELSFRGVSESFEGFGTSKKEAMRLAAKRAHDYIEQQRESHGVIADAVGDFDFDSAIGKLQMLSDKKIISGLNYYFREEPTGKSNNGNPTWYCQCVVDGVDVFIEYGDTKKVNAKKAAAFTMLQILTTGRDMIYESLTDDSDSAVKGGDIDD